MRPFSAFLSVFLIPLLAVMPLQAELGSSTAGSAQHSAGATMPVLSNLLKIRLADDSKATVDANTFVNGYAIAVSDAAGSPVADAAVAIRFPEEGATAFFISGEHSAVAYTNQYGVAQFPQVNWGAALGTVAIRVTAVKGDLHAGALIEQTIVEQRQAATAPDSMAMPISPAGPVAPVSTLESNAEIAAAPAPASSSPAASKPPRPDSKRPGTPVSVAVASTGGSAQESASAASPAVSVVTTGGSQANNHSNRKWIILAAVLAGAGVGAALALSAKGGGAVGTAAAATTTIGTPTISLGH